MHQFLCPSIIGRDHEITELSGALRNAIESRGSALFLVGEAGIGKSRLIREAVGQARDLQVQVMTGRSTQFSSTVAFKPWSEALFSYFRDRDLPDDPGLEPFRASLARLIPQWRQGDERGVDESVVLLAEAILRLLRVVAENGACVLILEDLHWADPETLSIVEYVSENLASEPVLLLCKVTEYVPASRIAFSETLSWFGHPLIQARPSYVLEADGDSTVVHHVADGELYGPMRLFKPAAAWIATRERTHT
ncbi:MAG: AAA family ATPase, partial [Aeromicrobium sp.]